MGIDIHSWLEVRDVPRWRCATRRTWNEDEQLEDWDEPYDSRNSSTFAILAGVWNLDWLLPIFEPRGAPPDVSVDGERRIADLGDDAFGHSWLTLRDIVEFDWTRRYVARRSCPFAEADALFASGALRREECFVDPDSQRVSFERCESYAAACDGFLRSVPQRMAALGGPDDVRIVFCFG